MPAAPESLYKATDDYLLTAITRVQSSGARLTDFHAGSATRTLLEALAAQLSHHSLVAEQLRLDSYLSTATGDALDRKAADYSVQRTAAVPASGTVRLTRQSTTSAVTVPAGWTDLLTQPVPGQQPLAFRTTADAVFGIGVSTVVVTATAADGGASGNIAAGVKLLPVDPVAGFATDGGFVAETTFVGGVDQETDNELRARVPLEVQGRVKGRTEAFQAAALRIAGVESVQVLRAGDARADASVIPGGSLEVYYEGVPALLSDVTTACQAAAVANQTVTVLQGTAERIVANLTVFCIAGTDTTALAVAVRDAAIDYVNSIGTGRKGFSSGAVQAVQKVSGVVSQTIPWTDLRLFTASSGVFGDLTILAGRYPSLVAADVTVAVVTLPAGS